MKRRHILALLLLGGFTAPLPVGAQIYNNWAGGGSISVGTTTTQITSTSREQSSATTQVFSGSAYSATGENVSANGPLGIGATYTITNNDGSPFQFSETFQPAGLTSITTSERSVETTTLQNSLSVFANVGQ